MLDLARARWVWLWIWFWRLFRPSLYYLHYTTSNHASVLLHPESVIHTICQCSYLVSHRRRHRDQMLQVQSVCPIKFASAVVWGRNVRSTRRAFLHHPSCQCALFDHCRRIRCMGPACQPRPRPCGKQLSRLLFRGDKMDWALDLVPDLVPRIQNAIQTQSNRSFWIYGICQLDAFAAPSCSTWTWVKSHWPHRVTYWP